MQEPVDDDSRGDPAPQDPFERFALEYAADNRTTRSGNFRAALRAYLMRNEDARAALADALLEVEFDVDPERTTTESSTEPTDARRIGPYRILRELGSGGQAVVYLAQDTRLPRSVALKVLPDANVLASSQVAQRLELEAKVTSRLDHPSICPIFETGRDDSLLYVAMRYVEGRTLASHIDRAVTVSAGGGSAFSLELPESQDSSESTHANELTAHALRSGRRRDILRTLRFFELLARALHTAHESGVVHRDVKPRNVMVTPTGDPVVLDFGLARDDAADHLSITRTGDVMGTPAYMSPEQVRGGKPEPDRRTDVYSLGVTLYEALTGKRPFDGANFETIRHRILAGAPPNPRRLRRAITAELRTVLRTAMELDRDRRYPTALDFAEDLHRIRALRPIHADAPGLGLRTRRWVQRNPVVTAFIALIVVAALVVGILYRTAQSALDDFSRLADAEQLAQLENEAVRELWEQPDRVAALEAWVARADALLTRYEQHVAKLEQLRSRAMPERPEVRRDHPYWARYERFRQRLAAIEAGNGHAGGIESARSNSETYRTNIAKIEARFDRDRGYRFASTSDQVLHDTLSDHVTRLRAFRGRRGTWTIAKRVLELARARAAAKATSQPTNDTNWQRAIEQIAKSSTYGGLTIARQADLVPLRPDPISGYFEFAHPPSGSLPNIDSNSGALQLEDTTCMIFVLLPAATFRMGCQAADPQAAHYDPTLAETVHEDELFLADVKLDAFFISKYEMTQHQWSQLAGSNPSDYEHGSTFYGTEVTPRHPVENMTWRDAKSLLLRYGLALPTEAQWEFAARGDTTTPFSTGLAPGSLEGSANLLDRFAAERGFSSGFKENRPMPWSDGHAIHAPVGSFAPNRYGLHDMHGNVAEWCRDASAKWIAYPAAPRTGELLGPVSNYGTVRGGSFGYDATFARSACRRWSTEADRQCGCRPSRLCR